MRRRVLTLLRNAATPHLLVRTRLPSAVTLRLLAPIRLHRAPIRRRVGVTLPQAAAPAVAAAAEATEAEVVAVATVAVEGVAALMVVEAVRLPTLVTKL